MVDTIPAYVTSFSSTSAEDSIYKEDDKIEIKVVFSKALLLLENLVLKNEYYQ
ncbi:MAG: hypothetical protein U0T83_00180 [Bacteriovoracaceae bacterium]